MHLTFGPLTSSLPAHTLRDLNFNNLPLHWNLQFNKPTTFSLSPTPISSLYPSFIVNLQSIITIASLYVPRLRGTSPALDYSKAMSSTRNVSSISYSMPGAKQLNSAGEHKATLTSLTLNSVSTNPQVGLQWVLPSHAVSSCPFALPLADNCLVCSSLKMPMLQPSSSLSSISQRKNKKFWRKRPPNSPTRSI